VMTTPPPNPPTLPFFNPPTPINIQHDTLVGMLLGCNEYKDVTNVLIDQVSIDASLIQSSTDDSDITSCRKSIAMVTRYSDSCLTTLLSVDPINDSKTKFVSCLTKHFLFPTIVPTLAMVSVRDFTIKLSMNCVGGLYPQCTFEFHDQRMHGTHKFYGPDTSPRDHSLRCNNSRNIRCKDFRFLSTRINLDNCFSYVCFPKIFLLHSLRHLHKVYSFVGCLPHLNVDLMTYIRTLLVPIFSDFGTLQSKFSLYQ